MASRFNQSDSASGFNINTAHQNHATSGSGIKAGQHHEEQIVDELDGVQHRYVNMEPFENHSSFGTLNDLRESDEDEANEAGNESEHDDEAKEDDARQMRHDNEHEHRQFNYLNQNTNRSQVGYEQQLNMLRDLLKIERQNSQRHRDNNLAMRNYLQQLQIDYLRQQSDLVEALEFSHKLKAQKEAQIVTIQETVRDKDTLIDQLRTSLANLDESKLREEFNQTVAKQKQLAQLDQDQLRNQINTVEQQLVRERVNNSQLLQKFQEKVDEQSKVHDKELSALCSRLTQTQTELDRILSEPQNLIIKALREEKSTLEGKYDESNLILQELQKKYDSIKKRLEFLVMEQEQTEQGNQEEFDKLQQQHVEQRRSLNELKLELEDKQEIIQIMQFNLQRSEKRVKNLIGVLKSKEETYREMIGQMESKHQQEVERIRNDFQSIEKRLIDNESELDKKQNEIIRLRLEHDNQLESLRNDRDERLNRLTYDKQKLDTELKSTELRLAREVEQSSGKTNLIEQLQKDVKQFRDESKRLSIELTKSEAKLYAKQQELNQTLDSKASAGDNAGQISHDLSDTKLQQVSIELEEERRSSRRLKARIDELSKDNVKLGTKLRIAEANLGKMTMAINREHGKMMREYEKKLEQIRSEQAVYDKNKLRYKRYGYKLKKYCEHLRRVHEHLCNPTVCGYIIGSVRAMPATTSLNSSSVYERKSNNCDKMSLLSNEYDSDENFGQYSYDLEESISENNDNNDDSKHSIGQDNSHHSSIRKSTRLNDRFIIKRTGLNPALKRTPSVKSKKSFKNTGNTSPRTPLKAKDHNVQATERADNGHDYYYINEDHSYNKLCDQDQHECSRVNI